MSSNQDTAEAIDKYIQLLTSDPSNTPSYSYIRTIVLKAISDPKVFSGFADLRQVIEPYLTNITGADASGKAALLNTLSLFSYGTYQEYISTSGENTNKEESKDEGGMMSGYVALNEGQLMKLKALTVMSVVKAHSHSLTSSNGESTTNSTSLSSRQCRRNRRKGATSSTPTPSSKSSPKQVPYTLLQTHLNLPISTNTSIRPLEELLLYCIQSNLLPPGTKLDQRTSSLLLSHSPFADSNTSNSTLIRDVNLSELTSMIHTLESFQTQANAVKSSLESSSQFLRDSCIADAKVWHHVDASVEKTKGRYKALLKAQSGSGSSGGASASAAAGVPSVDWTGGASEFFDAAGTGRQIKRSKNRSSRGYGRFH